MRRIPLSQRREELIDAALRVIAREGLAAATTRAIVAEAEMPLGAFHYAFKDRDELLDQVVETALARQRFVAEAAALASHSLEEFVVNGLNAYIDELVAHPDYELAMFELAILARRQADEGKMRKQWEAYRRTATDLLLYASEVTGATWHLPVSELAHALIMVTDGITMAYLADQDEVSVRRSAKLFAVALAGHATSVA